MQPGQDPIRDLLVWGFILIQFVTFLGAMAVFTFIVYCILPRRTRRKVMQFFFTEEV